MSDALNSLKNKLQKMIALQGFYLLGDKRTPGADVPVLSMGGKVYVLQIEGELNTDHLVSTLTIQGPFRGNKVPVAYVYDGNAYLPVELDPSVLDVSIPLFPEQSSDEVIEDGKRLVPKGAAVEILPSMNVFLETLKC